jgi:hypothetical protein
MSVLDFLKIALDLTTRCSEVTKTSTKIGQADSICKHTFNLSSKDNTFDVYKRVVGSERTLVFIDNATNKIYDVSITY